MSIIPYIYLPKRHLSHANFSETKEILIRFGFLLGPNLNSNGISYIHDRFGGHPFFVRQLCSQIHKGIPYENRPVSVSMRVCRTAEENNFSDIQSYIRQVIDSLKEFYPDDLSMSEYLT